MVDPEEALAPEPADRLGLDCHALQLGAREGVIAPRARPLAAAECEYFPEGDLAIRR